MKCSKCKYWDAIDGGLCALCSAKAEPNPSGKKYRAKIRELQQKIEMYFRENERLRGVIAEQADALTVVIAERDALAAAREKREVSA